MNDDFEVCIDKLFYRINCPLPDELGDFSLKILPGPEYRRIQQHLKTCVLCREELKILSQFEKTHKKAGSAESSLLSVKDLFKRMGDQIGAIMHFPQKQLLSFRGEGQNLPVKCRLECENEKNKSLDLYMGLEEVESGFSIKVQCLSETIQSQNLAGALVEIWQEGNLIGFSLIDAFYTFQFRLHKLLPLVVRISNTEQLMYTFKIIFGE